jgi:hypothetical protein
MWFASVCKWWNGGKFIAVKMSIHLVNENLSQISICWDNQKWETLGLNGDKFIALKLSIHLVNEDLLTSAFVGTKKIENW